MSLLKRVLACVAAFALVAGLLPGAAWGYFNRGAVGVSLGAASVELAAGETVEVSVVLTPATDEQLEGCGMPSCPQGCAETCTDANGQCQCAGTEYSTYTATAVASTSDASVATAVYSANKLTVYGRGEGTCVVEVRASLRQYTDSVAELQVVVSGSGAAVSFGAEVEVPEEAVVEDRAAVVEKTVKGRQIRFVQIAEGVDALAELAGVEGSDADLTFWSGDTYYQPAYSVTFVGTGVECEGFAEYDPALVVSAEAQGVAYQALDGLSDFLLVEFACEGALPGEAKVYVAADSVFEDGDALALFSYDSAARTFVREEAEAAMSGGYAVFTVSEGKTYVVSSRDLASEGNEIISGGTSEVDSCCSSATIPPYVYVILGVVGGAALVLALGRVRKGKGGEDAL